MVFSLHRRQGWRQDSTVMELTVEFVRKLAGTPFCRSAIVELAAECEHLTEADASLLVAQLTAQGEAVALNRLLNVCALLEMRVDPLSLAGSVGTIDDITHLSYCARYQDANGISPLFDMVRSEELSWQRQAMAARIGTELALRHDDGQDQARRVLYHLREEIREPVTELLVVDSLRMLDAGKLEADAFPIMIEGNIRNDLPERPPAAIIGGGGTVRRPIAKLGRNDPCHCGSGRKYKRCCFEKDRDVLADASQYAGVTQTELHANPGIVDDPDVIRELRPYELKKLNPKDLATEQLLAASRRAQDLGLLDLAFDMLVERSARTDGEFEFDAGHFTDLMVRALDLDNLEVARRARRMTSQDCDFLNWGNVDMQFALQTDPGLVETVENSCKEALSAGHDYYDPGRSNFYDLAHMFQHKFPALSILFARAAVQQHPRRVLDNELLVENVHQARIDLGLEPWDDPIEDIFDEAEEDYERALNDRAQAEAERALRDELSRMREQANASARELADKEQALADLQRKLDRAAEAADAKGVSHVVSNELSAEINEDMSRLRRQVNNLKAEIGNQQEERKRLRQELERERRRAAKASASHKPKASEAAEEAPQRPPEKARVVLVPEYDARFRDAFAQLSATVGAKALRAVAGFAAYDAATWQHARSIKILQDVYRIRIGMHYRLLLRWRPGQTLKALDLIPRQDLESWIKRHA